MKIDPNAPAYPVDRSAHYGGFELGIPIRLAIAAQIMAAANGRTTNLPTNDEAALAMRWADALIAAYNKGQP